MPIYAYRCGACGHTRDVLQKLSDPVLVTCPACGAEAFSKQVTAAGFQLKGSGWYVTDFRGGNGAAPADKAEKPDPGDKKGAADKAETKPEAAAAASAPAPAPAPTAAPAAASSGKPSEAA